MSYFAGLLVIFMRRMVGGGAPLLKIIFLLEKRRTLKWLT